MPKNFRKVPSRVLRDLQRIEERHVIAGCAVSFDAASLAGGRLAHLQVSLDGNGLSTPNEVIPPAGAGKFSERNVHGHETKRRDLPTQPYTVSMEVPNWGDASNGTHTVYQDKLRYQIDFDPPRFNTINIECPHRQLGQERYLLKFQVSEVLDRDAANFEQRLLACLNLLQENVQSCGVVRSGATLADYVRTLSVSWELLPLGSREEMVQRVFRGRPVKRHQELTPDDIWN